MKLLITALMIERIKSLHTSKQCFPFVPNQLAMMKIQYTINNSGIACVERAQFRSHFDTPISVYISGPW